MAKLVLDNPVSSGGLGSPNIAEVRVNMVTVDFLRNRVEALFQYGEEINGRFEPSPIVPQGTNQVIVDLEQYQDVQAAWDNFQRKLFQRGVTEGILPPGQDSD